VTRQRSDRAPTMILAAVVYPSTLDANGDRDAG